MEDQEKQRRISPFLWNVAINVLANLIAAAIVYVGGVAFGLFPRSTVAVAISSFVILVSANWATLIAMKFIKTENRTITLALGSAMGGGSLLIAGFSELVPPGIAQWAAIGLGAVLICVDAALIWASVDLVKRNRAPRDRIKGLHWIAHS